MYYEGVQETPRPPRRGKFIPNEQLRMYRERRGLSQAQLAALAGCSQPDIHRLETGVGRTTAEWTVRLAPHIGVSPQDLFPSAPGSTRSDGGIDPDIMARSVAFARRLESDSDAIASEIITAAYALLALGIPIDSEAAIAIFEIFARRLRRLRPGP